LFTFYIHFALLQKKDRSSYKLCSLDCFIFESAKTILKKIQINASAKYQKIQFQRKSCAADLFDKLLYCIRPPFVSNAHLRAHPF